MYIYVVSNTTDKVLRSLKREPEWDMKDFFEKGLRMVLASNGKTLPCKILVSKGTVSYSGIDIHGCRLRIPHTRYGIFIQGLNTDDFELGSETEE